jgi:ParB/RepB/Spo0J family partition protein
MSQNTIEEKAITEIGDKFSTLRIVNPRAELAMEKSLQKYGQVSPVICARMEKGVEVIDGFKRLRACRKLGRPTLKTVYVETGVRVCKAAMIQLNRVSRSISDIEEAMVLQSLYREDGLTQVEIATLLSRDKSWVSRRISLIERLSEEVQQDIRLGLLTVSVGRELAKLPRGNPIIRSGRDHSKVSVAKKGCGKTGEASYVDLLPQPCGNPQKRLGGFAMGAADADWLEG